MPGALKGSISSTNGIDLPGDSKELNADISTIIASALKPTTFSSSIIDVAGPLHASLVARYPRAHSVTSRYSSLDIKSGVKVEGLSLAHSTVRTVLDDVRHTDTQKGVGSSTNYNVNTSWHLPISKTSLGKIIDITIKTTEHLTPSICNLPSEIVQSREHSKLGQLHPTFDVHLKAAERALPSITDDETAPIRLARLVFDLADEQSPCKRIDRVTIKMKISAKKTEKRSTDGVQTFSYTSIDRDRYEKSQHSKLTDMLPNGLHRVYIALGSNVGDRIATIESACQQMEDRGIKVTRTSALYETKAMYLEDQESFINGACEVSGAQVGRYS